MNGNVDEINFSNLAIRSFSSKSFGGIDERMQLPALLYRVKVFKITRYIFITTSCTRTDGANAFLLYCA